MDTGIITKRTMSSIVIPELDKFRDQCTKEMKLLMAKGFESMIERIQTSMVDMLEKMVDEIG
jgi:hypothetical protein